jgi:hyaluronate lyase
LIFNNQMMDMVRGRSLSRFSERGHTQAHRVLEKVLVLADGIEGEDPQRANQWRAMCKGWLERDTYDDMLNGAGIPTISIVSRLQDNTSIQPAPEPVAFTMFAGMARAVHRRPGWALGIAMASKRVAYYETGSGENIKGFHTGEGATYLYNDADNGHFEDEYWPTVDMYRIPGITLNKMPLPDKTGGEWGVAHPKEATWAGGVPLEGRYGTVGMDLEGIQHRDLVGVQPPLRARKSWFCFDRYVIALGAGITDVSGYPVETIVENRNLHAAGTNALILDGDVQPITQGWSDTRRVHWAHLEDVGGYVFPHGGAELHALREERTGRYQDIGSSSSGYYTRRFLTMWLDHGVRPDGAAYAYVLMPNATPEQTRELAESPDFVILANTADLQAVRVPELGLAAYNFFSAGRLAYVTANQPCSVMLRYTGSELSVAVSDPTQLSPEVELVLSLGRFELTEADTTVRVHSFAPRLTLRIDTSAMDGASHSARFRRA